MPIHPQDLQDYMAMLGNQPIPDGFEAEYEMWLAMNHRRNKQGPLGDLLVPLCRKFNLAPPVTPKAAEQVLWRKVERGTAVLVTLNGITAKGKYLGLGPYGEVEVLIDGQTWVQAVKPFQVALDTSLTLPPDLKLSPAEAEAMRPFVADSAEMPVSDDDLPAFDSTAVDEDEDEVPKMNDPRWYEAKPGDRLMVALGDDLPDAKFVKLGPGDGQVVVEVEGEEDVRFVLEEQVTIA